LSNVPGWPLIQIANPPEIKPELTTVPPLSSLMPQPAVPFIVPSLLMLPPPAP
jgi:hypothetical protein